MTFFRGYIKTTYIFELRVYKYVL